MTRWHHPDCEIPDIFVDATTALPSCRSCRCAPDLEKLLSEQKGHSPFPAPPPDEPKGQMDLWWPPSVPWVGETTRGRFVEEEETSKENNDPSTSNTSASLVYPDKLSHGEFRLACINSSPDHDQPVHLNLERYSVDNCPEFETVSYTWGGEEDDNTRIHPVFIGSYWDVTFQTRNCWELLRFVRPRRGIRLMWIDAICINQENDVERGEQVGQMGVIYRRCMQVVVYLGPDIAPPLPPDRYPKRRSLESIEDLKFRRGLDGLPVLKQDTASLLRRRYFSRLWVVQELVLASRVLMRVEDIDFWADRASGQERCADPRDRIFGLTGILQNIYFWADYSLSCQHVYLGLFADLMIRGKRYSLLEFGSGASHNTPSLPSWAPDWKSWDQWSIAVEPGHFNQYHMDHNRADALGSMISQLQAIPALRYHGMATILLSSKAPSYGTFLESKQQILEEDRMCGAWKTWLHADLEPIEDLFCPWAQNHKDMIPVYQTVINSFYSDEGNNAKGLASNALLSAYRRCLVTNSAHSRFFPSADSDPCFITLCIPWSVLKPMWERNWYGRAYDTVKFWIASTYGSERPCQEIIDNLITSFGSWLIYMIRLAEKRTGKQQDELLLDWCSGKSAPTDEQKLMPVPTGETSEILMDGFGCSGNMEKGGNSEEKVGRWMIRQIAGCGMWNGKELKEPNLCY
ncbi:heterokaryon incompatibility protein-domain-containing protein [Apiosordaria backusii]|uniref:Heterokaryon incompatibility protein-domain-containing protein n=1 Tax=Apiosordaria backusii TaxID=314023 RepID=A0AA40DFJ9_9PEZI|nr:heterokaryon incompatibility protein-domain-containing protein [Apiosordaria backusii]